MENMHRDASARISRPEFIAQFARWFTACDLDADGATTQPELEKAILKATPLPALIPQSKPATAPR
jgi:hypothetical protein